MKSKADIPVEFVIVSEKMVWQFYYDKFKTKHLKELLGDEARKFVENLPVKSKEKHG